MGTEITNKIRKICFCWRIKAILGYISRSDPTFLDRIITTGKTWVHYYESEEKRMSMVWKNRDSPPPNKAKVVKVMGK